MSSVNVSWADPLETIDQIVGAADRWVRQLWPGLARWKPSVGAGRLSAGRRRA